MKPRQGSREQTQTEPPRLWGGGGAPHGGPRGRRRGRGPRRPGEAPRQQQCWGRMQGGTQRPPHTHPPPWGWGTHTEGPRNTERAETPQVGPRSFKNKRAGPAAPVCPCPSIHGGGAAPAPPPSTEVGAGGTMFPPTGQGEKLRLFPPGAKSVPRGGGGGMGVPMVLAQSLGGPHSVGSVSHGGGQGGPVPAAVGVMVTGRGRAAVTTAGAGAGCGSGRSGRRL